MICAYCDAAKTYEGWHDCPQAQSAKAHIEAEVAEIHKMFDGSEDRTPLTSDQLHERANQRRNNAQGVIQQKGEVKEWYEPLGENQYDGRDE